VSATYEVVDEMRQSFFQEFLFLRFSVGRRRINEGKRKFPAYGDMANISNIKIQGGGEAKSDGLLYERGQLAMVPR
jgi:hypothetical protein